MDKREFKDEIYGELETIGKALANRHRLELLDVLAQSAHTVEELAAETSMSVANTSQHLQRLKKARLVATEREGTYVYYRLANESVAAFLVATRRLAHQRLPSIDAMVQTYFADQPARDWHIIKQDLAAGRAVLIDARPESEFENDHIPGALSVPVDRLSERLHKIPTDKELVAYCRGPYCTMASQLVARLREEGFEARRVEISVQDFRYDQPTESRG